MKRRSLIKLLGVGALLPFIPMPALVTPQSIPEPTPEPVSSPEPNGFSGPWMYDKEGMWMYDKEGIMIVYDPALEGTPEAYSFVHIDKYVSR